MKDPDWFIHFDGESIKSVGKHTKPENSPPTKDTWFCILNDHSRCDILKVLVYKQNEILFENDHLMQSINDEFITHWHCIVWWESEMNRGMVHE